MPMKKEMKTLDEALDYLYSFINYEVDSSYAYGAVHYNVERTVKLLKLLQNPQKSFDIIHVAGTKGKGSVCAILDGMLRAGGYTTGLFTSPHVHRVNERIQVNGNPIGDNELLKLINLFPTFIDSFRIEDRPTTFEILTAAAVYYFKEKGTRFGILETGMGGRFDSTNFSDPVITIITPISYDHMDKLGDRIQDIAFEKAGIMKRGKPVVIGYQVYDVEDVFQGRARRLGCPLYRTQGLCSYRVSRATEKGMFFDAVIDGEHFSDLFLSLSGRHQVENAVTALLSLKILDLLPDSRALTKSLSSIKFPTRLELFEKDRRFLLDSAHNADSARVLVQAIRDGFKYKSLTTIVGIVKEKDSKGILQQLEGISDQLIITEPVTHKELDTDSVFQIARSFGGTPKLIRNIEEAINYAVGNSASDDLILITGSFYTTSPARSYILGRDR
jgi:dihydrofolate synthase/folylpolyglutamate synthase